MRGESLIEYLHDENVRRFAFKTVFFKDKNIEFASDFDVFSAICDSISLFICHPVRNELIFAIKHYVEDVDPFLLCNVEYRKEIWQRVFCEDFEPSFKNSKTVESFNTKGSSLVVFEKSADIKSLVEPNCNTIFEVLDSVLEKIKNDNIKIINFDVRAIRYSRPDDFHAMQSYNQFVNGKGGDVFLLWLLCRIFMNFDLKLRLIVNSSSEAKQVLNLLSSIKLSPCIYICFDVFKENEYQNFIDIVLENYKKNISLELCFSKEIDKNNLSVVLKKLIHIIPIACIKVSNDNFDVFLKALDIALAGAINSAEKSVLLNFLSMVK